MLLRVFFRSAIVALLVSSTGCGILIQSVMGWSERHTETRSERHNVEVSSVPAGAEVKRKNPGGSMSPLGPAPFTDEVTYDVEVTIAQPRFGGLLAGGLIDLLISIGFIYALHEGGNGDAAADVYILSLVAIPELVAAAVWGASGPSVKARKQIPSSQWYTYYANKDGLPEASVSVRAPDQGRAELKLATQPLVAKNEDLEDEPGQMKTAVEAQPSWVIAVMDVEDVNAAKKEHAIDKALIESLGDQLRIVIAQQGVRTIDREVQDRALADQISAMQNQEMTACNDDSCQLELGRAVAASHIVRARVTRVGQECVFNAELIELAEELTAASSSLQGECAAQGLFNMSEEAAKRLVARPGVHTR